MCASEKRLAIQLRVSESGGPLLSESSTNEAICGQPLLSLTMSSSKLRVPYRFILTAFAERLPASTKQVRVVPQRLLASAERLPASTQQVCDVPKRLPASAERLPAST
jgi:hypothetical protein